MSPEGGPAQALSPNDLASVIGAIAPQLAKQGVILKSVGGEDEEEPSKPGNADDADKNATRVDRTGTQGTANPGPYDDDNEDDPYDPNKDGFKSWLNRQSYEDAPYHPNARHAGAKNPRPTNGGDALRFSTRFSETSSSRVAVDPDIQEFVVYIRTQRGLWHGHIRQWSELDQKQQSVLRKLGYVNKKGRIIVDSKN